MKIFENAGIDAGYVLLGIMAVQLIFLILYVVLFLQHIRMKKRYQTFLQGETGKSLESSILKKFKEIDTLTSKCEVLEQGMKKNDENIQLAFQKVGLVKYDAFKEMGGKLSFSLCMLDNHDNGLLITSMHTREGCYTYSKEIIKGESYVILAEEEKRALEQAKNRASADELD